MSGETERPERKTRTLPNGDVVYEAGDCQFVASSSGTVHERAECDGAEHDYEYHPKCGQRLPEGSLWGSIDADDAAEAVLKYDKRPCSRCLDAAYRLERWRKALHSPTVMHGVDVPEEYQQYGVY